MEFVEVSMCAVFLGHKLEGWNSVGMMVDDGG